MSWMKRRGPSTPSPAPVPAPAVPMYNPNQHSNAQETQWQNQQIQNTWYQRPQQMQYQQAPKQEPQVAMQQQNWQHPPYDDQMYYQQQPSYYQHPTQNQPHQQMGVYQNNTGYEQQAYGNVQYNQPGNQNEAYGNYAQTAPTTEQPGDDWDWGWGDEDNSNLQAQHNRNAGQEDDKSGIAAANEDSWNWPAEEAQPFVATTSNTPKPQEPSEARGSLPQASQQPKPIKTESVSPVVDHLILTGKRGKLHTPQWSTESQLSQESSDDVLHTSESDKSHMMSRSSTISHSPVSGQEPVPLPHGDEVPVKKEPYENKEIVTTVPPLGNPTPPPPQNLQTPPLMPPGGSDDSKNPYKRTTGLSHKAANQSRVANITPTDSRQAYQPNAFHVQQVNLEAPPDNSEQPDPVPSSSQTFTRVKPVTNLPDNNEAPINDRNQYLETGHLSESNLPDFNREAEAANASSDPLPPPGLRRMVPGQTERHEEAGEAGGFGDEPPPGLSRMVLGQTEAVEGAQMTNSSALDNGETNPRFDASGPPEGLRRMVPGESSSPEAPPRAAPPSRRADEDDDSGQEFGRPQPRSAAVGADTPPMGGQAAGGGRLRGVEMQARGRAAPPEARGGDSDASVLASAMRDLTVGENRTDGQPAAATESAPPRRSGGRDSSDDSGAEDGRPQGGSAGRREAERARRDKERGEKGRERDRYTPESYRERKYDRRYKNSRYEEDTDYYSDKEKDRRIRDDKTRDYERKFSSLRKDKDRDRRRRAPRDPREYPRDPKDPRDHPRDSRDPRDHPRDSRDPRDYRREDYYYRGRYDDGYDHEGRSRPSSRTDSMHDSYRERAVEKEQRDRRPRDRDRERERYNSRRSRDPRDMYNPYQSFSYDPYNPYYQQYQYYENLRRTNPQAYAEWYRKYYQQVAGQNSSYGGGDDRASVHSGRSSANDEMGKDSFSRPFDQTDSSLNLDDSNVTVQRLTPAKFATAHTKGAISSGRLVRILPHYPMDGQNATVEICLLPPFLLNDDEYREMSQFPGPLVKGVTHKKTIIEYCENKIREAGGNKKIVDVDSYVLMWELLMLLIRQNGMVVGTDIAELLLKNRREIPPPRSSSALSSISSNNGEVNPISESSTHPISENTGSLLSIVKEEEVTNKFREFLLYGSGKEALEWAMRHGLWGHALFLASKLDKRTYANVMMRFANGLTLNDPLQTLYQLLSGKMPAAVTCVSEEKWGDWRPHLAMILSNSTQRPELNRKAITTMGDTLLSRGCLHAAQFCYLMAEVGFGNHDDPEARLVLLGADHTRPYPGFATNEAIHMTEIYEYACGLNDSEFVIPQFQVFKYLLATRLTDRGMPEKALAYLEQISMGIVSSPGLARPSFVDGVYALADRLKFHDPVEDDDEAEDESEIAAEPGGSRPDQSWLRDLRAVQSDYQNGMITHQSLQNLEQFVIPAAETDLVPTSYAENSQNWQQFNQQQQYQQPPWQAEQPQQVTSVDYQQEDNQNAQLNDYGQPQYQDQQNSYWEGQQQQWGDQVNQYNQDSVDPLNNFGVNTQVEPKEVEKDALEVSTEPPNTSRFSLPMANTLRKRLTALSPTLMHGDAIEMQKLKPDKPPKRQNCEENRSPEEFRYSRQESSDLKSSSRESSDLEVETYIGRRRQKNVSHRSEEKSQLIRYKDNAKVTAVKKYNTFDMKSGEKGKLVKYKSLDIPESKTVVKYLEPSSKVSISAEDFRYSDYRFSKFDRKHKHDIITDTVDAWSKKSGRNVFSNIKNSLFKSGSEKEVVYKPLVFGGTYPIDCPTFEARSDESIKPRLPKSQSVNLGGSQFPRMREYGPPRTFDIDQPI